MLERSKPHLSLPVPRIVIGCVLYSSYRLLPALMTTPTTSPPTIVRFQTLLLSSRIASQTIPIGCECLKSPALSYQ